MIIEVQNKTSKTKPYICVLLFFYNSWTLTSESSDYLSDSDSEKPPACRPKYTKVFVFKM